MTQDSIATAFLWVAVLFGLQTLTGCQTAQKETETYGGGHRKVEAPSAKEVKRAMDTTKSRADKDMAAVLGALWTSRSHRYHFSADECVLAPAIRLTATTNPA